MLVKLDVALPILLAQRLTDVELVDSNDSSK